MNEDESWKKVEPNPPTSDHEHDWRPIPTWSGRYRCTSCSGIGYRAIVTADKLDENDKVGATAWVPRGYRANQIVPYLCQKRGCGKVAVTRWKGKQLCSEHSS